MESGLQPAEPAVLAEDRRAVDIARGSRPGAPRSSDPRSPGPRSPRRSGQHEARGALALALRAGAAPAAGPPGECGPEPGGEAAGSWGWPTRGAGGDTWRGRGTGSSLLPALAQRAWELQTPKPGLPPPLPPPSVGAA